MDATRTAAFAVAVVAWAAALALPALGAGGLVLDGLDVLLRGWEGLSRAVLAWYANPCFVLAAILGWSRFRRGAVAAAGAALALALSSFATNALAAFTGSAVPDVTLHAGFWVWLGAHVVLLAWAVLALRYVPAPNALARPQLTTHGIDRPPGPP